MFWALGRSFDYEITYSGQEPEVELKTFTDSVHITADQWAHDYASVVAGKRSFKIKLIGVSKCQDV